jgi:hypothetical protein
MVSTSNVIAKITQDLGTNSLVLGGTAEDTTTEQAKLAMPHQ